MEFLPLKDIFSPTVRLQARTATYQKSPDTRPTVTSSSGTCTAMHSVILGPLHSRRWQLGCWSDQPCHCGTRERETGSCMFMLQSEVSLQQDCTLNRAPSGVVISSYCLALQPSPATSLSQKSPCQVTQHVFQILCFTPLWSKQVWVLCFWIQSWKCLIK